MNNRSRATAIMLTTILCLFGIAQLNVGAFQTQSPHQHGAMSGYLPQRVYSSDEKRFTDFESLLSDAAKGDVLFVGEEHNDPATHRIELAVLEGVARRRTNVVLAMEMFERDVQPVLNDYLADKISLEQFLDKSRPWPNFLSDYHFLVEFAKSHHWQVIASNIPRPLAAEVSRNGLSALDKLSPAERANAAKQFECPNDDYRKRFAEAMGAHPGVKSDDGKDDAAATNSMVDKFYLAQCTKDETMAESIVNVLNTSSGSKPFVVHVNGNFHSDFHEGTAARVVRRLPNAKVRTVSVIPVSNLDTADGAVDSARADYLVFVLKPE